MKRLCSACLLGHECRYDGKSKINFAVLKLAQNEQMVAICPEQLGGLCTPRTPAEIQGGSGDEVLDGNALVIDKNGNDVTAQFIEGAKKVLKIAIKNGISEAILTEKSPSCGSTLNYDGTFTHTIIDGSGVTTALLRKSGITVISERDIESQLDNS